MNAKLQSERRIVGALMVMGGMTFLALLEGLGKNLMQSLPWTQVLFFRFFAHFALLAPFVIFACRGRLVVEFHPRAQIMRGAFAGAAALFFVLALSKIPLARAIALFAVCPFVVAALSFITLGERVRIMNFFIIFGGFCGVLFIARPDIGLDWHNLAAIAGGFCYAGFLIMSRKIPAAVPAMASSFYVAAVNTAMVLPLLFWTEMLPMDGEMLMIVLLIGVISVIAQYLLARAFNFAPAAFLAPFTYWQIIAGAIVGFILHNHIPGIRDSVGIAVIIICGILLMLHGKKKGGGEIRRFFLRNLLRNRI